MKQLKAWWHWFDNEDPSDTAAALCRANESLAFETEWEALERAGQYVAERTGRDRFVTTDEALIWALDTHPEALRDLSLALCEALERMRERVPEAPQHIGLPRTKAFPELPVPPEKVVAHWSGRVNQWLSAIDQQERATEALRCFPAHDACAPGFVRGVVRGSEVEYDPKRWAIVGGELVRLNQGTK